MKKLIFTMAVVFATAISSYGQEVEAQTTEEPVGNFRQFIKSNWFVSFGAGVEGRFNSIDELTLSPVPIVDFGVGKWLFPYIAFRLQYKYAPIWGSASYANSFVNEDPDGNLSGNIQVIHGDVVFSLMSIIDGYYREDRPYDLMPYIGLGFSRSSDANTSYTKDYPVFGIANSFRITNAVLIKLEFRASPANAGFYGTTYDARQRERVVPVSTSLGITYKFKPRGWRLMIPEGGYSMINVYERNSLTRAEAEGTLRPTQKEIVTDTVTVDRVVRDTVTVDRVVREVRLSSNIIFFELDKSSLTRQNRVSLSHVASVINSVSTNQLFTITGYADEKTGSVAHNEKLSKDRAEAVYDILVNEFNVDKRKLRIDYKGGVDDMFYNDNVLSRCVIIQ